MSEYRTILEARLRELLKPSLDPIFAETIDGLDSDGVDGEIIANARENAARQLMLWTNALVTSFADTLETASSSIDHNMLLNYAAEKHFIQTEITKVSDTLTGILQSVSGVLQGTDFVFGELENNKVLKLVEGVIVSGTITGTGSASDAVEHEDDFGLPPNAGDSEEYSRGDHTHGTPENPVPSHSALSTGVHGSGANSIEHTGHKNASNGYAGLNADAKVPAINLGGAGANGTKFLKDDLTWSSPGESSSEEAIRYSLMLG